MSRLEKSISVLLFSASVFGLFLSMAHYHSAGLECLHHADEQHYTESEITCPVCALHVQNDSDPAPSFSAILHFDGFLFIPETAYLQQQPILTSPGRAPPHIA